MTGYNGITNYYINKYSFIQKSVHLVFVLIL